MTPARPDFEYTLIDSRNYAFAKGQAQRLPSNSDWSMVAAGAMLTTVLGMIFLLSLVSLVGALLSDDVTNLGNRIIIILFTGAATAFLLYMTLDPLRTMRANRRLAHDGQIVRGEVTDTEFRQMSGNYALRVSYTFQSPQGHTLMGTTGIPTGPRPAIPARGTSLAILYVHDKLHRAL